MQVPATNREFARDREALPPARAAVLLKVEDLSVRYCMQGHEFTVLDGISFELVRGQVAGLLGESGCGKTTTAISLLGLLPTNARITRGSISLDGRDLRSLHENQLRELRGVEMSLIYQDSNTLNPVMRAGDQVSEVLRAHKRCTPRQAREETESLFVEIGLSDAPRIYEAYPHQLSGGQRQRVGIAQALICKPRLVIADEPTASVDGDTAAAILHYLKRLRDDSDTALLFITHDPGALAAVADRIMVMYAGQIVEDGPLDDTYADPLHPYTRALLRCAIPVEPANYDRHASRLPFIPGSAPNPLAMPPGCSFANRCIDRMAACDRRTPQCSRNSVLRSVRCLKYEA